MPLTLTSPGPDRLVYAIPIWFRSAMGLLVTVVVASLAVQDSRPGLLAWVVLALVALSALYHEKWIFDAAAGRVVHRFGLVIAPWTTVIELETVDRFCIVPMVRGTIPGTEDARIESAAALRGGRADDRGWLRARYKKPFLNLEMTCADGTRHLIDHVPARRVARLRDLATRLAALCGKPLVER